MNKEIKTTKKAFGMTEEEFFKMMEAKEQSSSFDDPALDQFVKKQKESIN